MIVTLSQVLSPSSPFFSEGFLMIVFLSFPVRVFRLSISFVSPFPSFRVPFPSFHWSLYVPGILVHVE